MNHVVMYSGGIGGWGAAKRVVAEHGAENLTLLFTDTKIEDPDLYRVLDESSRDVFQNMEPNLVKIADGRDPWQVFFDERFLGNSRVDPCSKILKRKLADKWLRDNCDPSDTTVYLGIDWSEEHRFDDGEGRGARWRYAANGWNAKAPLCDPPYVMKNDLIRDLEARGVRKSHLYDRGFPHDNCGGFCVKAGIAHFVHLLSVLPERFLYHEQKEQDIRAFLGKDVSILTETVSGLKRNLTLRDLRKRIEAGGQYDLFAWGGCGCFESEAA